MRNDVIYYFPNDVIIHPYPFGTPPNVGGEFLFIPPLF